LELSKKQKKRYLKTSQKPAILANCFSKSFKAFASARPSKTFKTLEKSSIVFEGLLTL
jgi:hypothetical protein